MIAAICLSFLLAVSPSAETLEMEDLLRLQEAGIPTDVMVAQIEASPAVFRPGVEDLIRLREAGVADEVLRALTAPPSQGGAPAYRAVPKADGGILLTNVDEEGRPIGAHRAAPVNVIPRSAARTLPAANAPAPGRTPLPPGEFATEPEPWVRSSPIGHRWHPSWEEPRTGYPTEARLSGGWAQPYPYAYAPTWGPWGGGTGYYFLPAAYGPRGPSSFGRFAIIPHGHRPIRYGHLPVQP